MTSLVQQERLPPLAKGCGFTIPLIEQRGERSACDRQSGLVGPCEPVDRLAELEVLWMVPSDFVDQRQRRPYRAVCLAIGDDKSDGGNDLTRKLGCASLHSHLDRFEADPGEVPFVHHLRDGRSIEPWCACLLEGTIGAASFRQVRPFEVDGAWVVVQGSGRSEV